MSYASVHEGQHPLCARCDAAGAREHREHVAHGRAMCARWGLREPTESEASEVGSLLGDCETATGLRRAQRHTAQYLSGTYVRRPSFGASNFSEPCGDEACCHGRLYWRAWRLSFGRRAKIIREKKRLRGAARESTLRALSTHIAHGGHGPLALESGTL